MTRFVRQSLCAAVLPVLLTACGCGGNAGDKGAQEQAAQEAYIEAPAPAEDADQLMAKLKIPDAGVVSTAMQYYVDKFGRYPATAKELADARLIPPLPTLPQGYAYFLNQRAAAITIVKQ